MPWPKYLVFTRHAESEGNIRTADERAAFECSTCDYKLTPRGEEQARITGEYLRNKFGSFDRYYTSYYVRSRQTHQIMFPGVEAYEDPRLAEAQRGIWHTMPKEAIEKYFPYELTRKKREGLYHYRPFGGENWPDIELRAHSMLGTFNRDYPGETIHAVVHGHWQILVDRLIQRFSIDEALRRYKASVIKNASVTVYEGKIVNGKPRLVLLDQVVPWEGKIPATN